MIKDSTKSKNKTQTELIASPKCAIEVKARLQLANIIRNAIINALLLLEKKLSR